MFGLFKQRQNEIDLENSERFLRDELGNEIENTARKLSNLEKQIFSCIEGLEKSVEELMSIENANTFTSNLKNKYCKKALGSIKSITEPGDGYSEKKMFAGSLASALNQLSNIDIKEFRHLGVFSVKMSKISSQIGQISKLCSSYTSLLNGSKLEDVFTASSLVNDARIKYGQYISIENEIKTGEKTLPFIENEIHSLQLKMNEIDGNIEEIELKGMTEEEKQKNTIETLLSTEFGSIERSIRKFVHDCEIEKNDTEIIKKYLDNPGETFLLYDDGSVIKRNLIKMREAILRGEFTDDNKEKIERIIRSMDFFLSMREQYHGIIKSLERFHKKVEDSKRPLEKQRQSAKEEIHNLYAELKHLKDTMEKKKNERDALKREILSDINRLSGWVSTKVGRPISIKHSFDIMLKQEKNTD